MSAKSQIPNPNDEGFADLGLTPEQEEVMRAALRVVVGEVIMETVDRAAAKFSEQLPPMDALDFGHFYHDARPILRQSFTGEFTAGGPCNPLGEPSRSSAG